MTPNLEEPIDELEPPLKPQRIILEQDFTEPESLSDQSSSSSDVNSDEDISANQAILPLEHNFKQLLLAVTSTEDLRSVTQIRLRVISREVSLQHLSFYTPALRELILDGSVVNSTRDLGCELKNLKVLKMNRCQLESVEGISGLECLEELYAADNSIRDIVGCASYLNLVILDLQRNNLNNLSSLAFLNLCPELRSLYLKGNEISSSRNYKKIVGRILPSLERLDGDVLAGNDENCNDSSGDDGNVCHVSQAGNKTKPIRSRKMFTTSNISERFSVSFPPKIFTSGQENTTKNQ